MKLEKKREKEETTSPLRLLKTLSQTAFNSTYNSNSKNILQKMQSEYLTAKNKVYKSLAKQEQKNEKNKGDFALPLTTMTIDLETFDPEILTTSEDFSGKQSVQTPPEEPSGIKRNAVRVSKSKFFARV